MWLFCPCNSQAFPCWAERIGEARTSGTQCHLCEGGRGSGDEDTGSTADRGEATMQLGNGPRRLH